MQKKNKWSSTLAYVLAATGAAVGLGPIWQFPYKVGVNGGAGFVLVFILSLVFIGIPALIAETAIGKITKTNAVDSLKILAKQHNGSGLWVAIAWIGAITLTLVLSFYSVVAGWSIAYLFKAVTFKLATTASRATNDWLAFLGDYKSLLFYHSIFMLMTLYFVTKEVNLGIEKASKIMMPALFIILFIICLVSIFYGDLTAALKFLFLFNLKALNAKVFINALGQALFILAVGAGCMLVYGSYCDNKVNIAKNSIIIASLTATVALVSGIAIFPLVFANNIAPQGGSGLMFIVLPQVLAKIAGGNVIAALFFILLIFAALTSSISLAEPLVVLVKDKFKMSRFQACILVGALTWAIGVLCLLSFNLLADYKLFSNYNFFELITSLAVEVLLPIGCLGFSIFAVTKISKNKLMAATNLNKKLFVVWYLLTKYMVPLAIIVILAANFNFTD